MSQKRILIISSNFTGHGHKSISESLAEQLSLQSDVMLHVVDGFSLIGQAGIRASKLYGPLTRNAQDIWKLSYNLTSRESGKAVEDVLTALVYDRFMRCITQFQPGLIVTVHALFTRSLLNILEYHRIDIPFVVLQADIINIHPAWCDRRASLTFCPTQEAYECSRNVHHMPEKKLELCGFPTRERFIHAAKQPDIIAPYDGTRPLRCLLMSGGEGSGNLMKYARQLLEHVDCTLSIVCGRNKKLKQAFDEQLQPLYPGRIEAHGFLENVQDHMKSADLVIARGSPNTMLEAIVMGVPLMITGSLPGQESDNPALVVTHNLGVVCGNPESAPALVKALMNCGGKRLTEIREAQRNYRNFDSAKNLAARLYELARENDSHDARPMRRFPITLVHSRYGHTKPKR